MNTPKPGLKQKNFGHKFADNWEHESKQQEIHRQNTMKYTKNRIDVSALILLGEKDELEASFILWFYKYGSINDQILSQHLQRYPKMKFSDFNLKLNNLQKQYNKTKGWLEGRTLENSSVKKFKSSENVRKASFDNISGAPKIRYNLQFESEINHITLLLDLSPYMLIYDSSTKSFPLKNMEQIIRSLMVGLQWHFERRKSQKLQTRYIISAYGFSTQNQKISEFIKDQQIILKDAECLGNKDMIRDYINLCVSMSRYPYSEGDQKISINTFIQKVVNCQKSKLGLNTIITISTFQDIDTDTRILFNSKWITLAFICAGQLNFATYTIEDIQIIDRLPSNPVFRSKFIYKCQFIENWEKIQIIQKNLMKLKHLTTVTKKNRTILFNSEGKRMETIFEDILKYKFTIQNIKKKAEVVGTNQSYSVMQHHQVDRQKFEIPEENLDDIIETKYLQGWKVYQDTSSKGATFQLSFGNKKNIIYKAIKNSSAKTYTLVIESCDGNSHNQQMVKQKWNLMDYIKKIDLFNVYNFDFVNYRDSKKQRNYYQLESRNQQSLNWLNFIFDSHDEWSRYLKVKKLYTRFRPNFNLPIFNEFLSEISKILGDRITNLCFINIRKFQFDYNQGFSNRICTKWKVIFTKISCELNFLELKLGFLKYSQAEIKQYMKHFSDKLNNLTLNHANVDIVPEYMFKFCNQKFNIQPKGIFCKSWSISFPHHKTMYSMYKSYCSNILKKLGYQIMKAKNCQFLYYRIISFTCSNVQIEKTLFLSLNIYDEECKFTFEISTFPDFSMIQKKSGKNHNEKCLNFLSLFNQIVQELKQIQKKASNLIKNYAEIYQKLNKNYEKQVKNNKLKTNIRRSNLRNIIPSSVQTINIDEIPQPQKFLIQSEITCIKGDLTVYSNKHPQQSFTFFNINNVMIIYLCKKNSDIYYRCINIKSFVTIQPSTMWNNQQIEGNHNDVQLQKSEIKKIVDNIRRQEREQKYQLFYDAVCNGNDVGIMSQYQQSLKDVYQPELDFYGIVTIVRKSKHNHISYRFAAILIQLHKQFFRIIQCFFKASETHIYFSERKQAIIRDCPVALNPRQFQSFHNLILKLQYISEQDFVKMFLEDQQCYDIILKFYGFILDQAKIDCIISYLQNLINQCVVYLNLVTITQNSGLKSLNTFITSQSYVPIVKKSIKLPEEITNSYNDFLRYIQLLTTDKFLDFHIINEDPEIQNKSSSEININLIFSRSKTLIDHQFIANEDQFLTSKPGQKVNASFKVCLKYWIYMKTYKDKCKLTIQYLDFQYMSIYPLLKPGNFGEIIQAQAEQYIHQIIKAIKVHNNFKIIQKNLMFPLELNVPIYINDSNFRKIQSQKKKQKYHVPKPKKYRSKTLETTKQNRQSTVQDTNKAIPDPQTFHLKLIYEESLEFYAKFEPGQLLENLAHSEILNSSMIRNLQNTYIFLNQEIKQYFFFYLQQINQNCSTPKTSKNFKSQQLNFKNILKLSVYCIDECFKNTEKYLSHYTLIKKAKQQVTLNLIASDINLRLPPCYLDFQEEEYFKKGQKWSLTIKLPFINQKGNFRQYLKQHLETEFHHKRTQFRSQLQNKQSYNEKKEHLNTTLTTTVSTSISVPISISTKSSIGNNSSFGESTLHHSDVLPLSNNHCQKKCNPSMWIFNTLKQKAMHVKFGMCIYLLKINVQSSHSLALNTDLWKRYSKSNHPKTYIFPTWKNNSQSSQISIDHQQWSQGKGILQFLRKWGNGQTEYIRNYGNKQQIDHNNIDEHNPDANVVTSITFNILSYFGSPRFHELQKTYREFVYCSLADYWFQNYFFYGMSRIAIKQEQEKKSHGLRKSNSIESDENFEIIPGIRRADSSPHKLSQTNIAEPIESSPLKESYELLIKTRELMESSHQLSNSNTNPPETSNFGKNYQKTSSCQYIFSTYQNNKLLIQQKFMFFKKIIEYFIKLFRKTGKKFLLPFIIYCKLKDNSYLIWQICYCQNIPYSTKLGKNLTVVNNIRNSSSDSTSMNNSSGNIFSKSQNYQLESKPSIQQQSHEEYFYAYLQKIQNYLFEKDLSYQKLGILFLDNLCDIHDIKIHKTEENQQNKKEKQQDKSPPYEKGYFLSKVYNTEDMNIEFEGLKYFNENQSFCQNQYLFRRSLVMNFQCTTQGFCFSTYNFNQNSRQFLELKYYLFTMENWYSEKHRLLEFIMHVKKKQKGSNGYFEVPQKMLVDHDMLNQFKRQFEQLRKPGPRKDQISSLVLSKLIVELVFKKIPSPQMFLTYKDGIQIMYRILMKKQLHYQRYPQYKGKQKSILEKLGRQYLSILRIQYNFQIVDSSKDISSKAQVIQN